MNVISTGHRLANSAWIDPRKNASKWWMQDPKLRKLAEFLDHCESRQRHADDSPEISGLFDTAEALLRDAEAVYEKILRLRLAEAPPMEQTA